MTTRRAVLSQALLGQWLPVVGATLLLMCWQACESLVPAALGAIIDRAITPGDGWALLRWLAVLGGLFLVLSLSFRFGSRAARRAAEYAAHQTRVELTGAVLDPHNRPDPAQAGATLVSIATADADRVGTLAAVLPRTVAAAVSVTVAAVVLLRISAPVGLLVLIGAPLLLGLTQLLGGPLERRAGAEQARAAHAATLATDLVAGLRVVKGLGAEQAAADRYTTASQQSLRATLRAARTGSLYDATTLLATMLFLALIALVTARLAARGQVSVGDMIAAIGLGQFLIGPLGQLAGTAAGLARARASATRVAVAHDGLRHPTGTQPLPAPLRGELRWRLDGLDLAARPGELLGVVADPAHAAALVEATATAAYAERDDVLLDGVPLRRLAPDQLPAVLLVSRHDSHLFADTLLSNVLAGRPDNPRVREAIRAADVDQVADSLPEGLDTPLTERGRSLSGGQRQRVVLARALAADPPVLVLHDPTTAVDTATEARIAAHLRQQRRDRTTVLVTTSPTLLAVCDRVALIGAGRLVAEGSHADLETRHLYYRNLVRP